MTRIAIFASGNGTNCENLIGHFQNVADMTVALVVSNKADAPVVGRARRLGVPVVVVPKAAFGEPDGVLPVLRRHRVGFIVLAGFLLVVPDWLIRAYDHRIINLHPALLPKFGGKGMWGRHVHEAVKAAGEAETGFTVHWVSPAIDGGEVIAQRRVALLPTDSVDDIAAKEHRLEMECFPEIVEATVRKAMAGDAAPA